VSRGGVHFFSSIVTFLALTPLALRAQSAAELPAPAASMLLTQKMMQEIYQQLDVSSAFAGELNDEAWNRAALQGIQRQFPGIFELVPAKAMLPPPQAKLVSEMLTEKVAYLRPSGFGQEALAELDKALTNSTPAAAEILILDLRVALRPGPLEEAAWFLSRFFPPDTELFQIREKAGLLPGVLKSSGPRHWSKDVVLVVDAVTGPVAETIAMVIKQRIPKTLVFGEATPGKPLQYDMIPQDNDMILLLAKRRAVLPDGKPFTAGGLLPDFPMKMDGEIKQKIFIESERAGMKPFVIEKERPRNNEAALVQGTNPELDYQLAKSRGELTEFDVPPPRDVVVQHVMDMLAVRALAPAAEK
jgi:hypothetical protein